MTAARGRRAPHITARFAGLAALTLALGAPCAWAKEPPNPLDQAVRDGLTIKDVVVDWMVDDTTGAADPKYADSKANMIENLRASVGEMFKYSPYGSEPVVLHIRLKSFHRYEVVGDVALVRATDQQELAVYPKIDGFYLQSGSGGGLLGAVIGMATAGDSTVGTATCFAARVRARFNGLQMPPCQ